jgi:hypothetical protein
MKICILVRLHDTLLQITLDPLHSSAHLLDACTHTRMPRLACGIEALQLRTMLICLGIH